MHQYLFYIGDFPVRAYGLLLSLGIFCAAAIGYFLLKKIVVAGMFIWLILPFILALLV